MPDPADRDGGCITRTGLGNSGVRGRRWLWVAGWALARTGSRWAVIALAGAIWVGSPQGPVAGSGPMTTLARAVHAAQGNGVVFRTTLAEAQTETRLRLRGPSMLTRLANESLVALSERPGRPDVRRYADMTEVKVTGSGGSAASVQGNRAAFERSVWMSVRSGGVPVRTVEARAALLAGALRGVTGEIAEPLAAAQGLCGRPCRQMTPKAMATDVLEKSGARVVERASGSTMAVVLGYGRGEPFVDMAGREVNLEVVVTRTARGLVVQIGEPFVPPTWSVTGTV